MIYALCFALGFLAGMFWPQVKAKLLAWYDALVEKI